MNSNDRLLGLFIAGDSRWHRIAVGPKYLAVLVLSLPALIWQQPWLTAASLLACVASLLTTGIAPRLTLVLPRALIVWLAVLAAVELLLQQPALAFVVPGNLLIAVLAARLVTFTTSPDALIDATVAAFAPLPGVDEERLALALAVMIRSVPHLLGSFAEVRDAARARGLERNLLARLTPVVVRAVAYAQATGEALDARGLGQPRGPRPAATPPIG